MNEMMGEQQRTAAKPISEQANIGLSILLSIIVHTILKLALRLTIEFETANGGLYC